MLAMISPHDAFWSSMARCSCCGMFTFTQKCIEKCIEKAREGERRREKARESKRRQQKGTEKGTETGIEGNRAGVPKCTETETRTEGVQKRKTCGRGVGMSVHGWA